MDGWMRYEKEKTGKFDERKKLYMEEKNDYSLDYPISDDNSIHEEYLSHSFDDSPFA